MEGVCVCTNTGIGYWREGTPGTLRARANEINDHLVVVRHAHGLAVRQATLSACCAMQGFPRGAVSPLGAPRATTPAVIALGNSMAVNVMHWVGRRINSRFTNEAMERNDAKHEQ